MLKKSLSKKKEKTSYFNHFRGLVIDQSSPVHLVSESRGGGDSINVIEKDKQRDTNPCV